MRALSPPRTPARMCWLTESGRSRSHPTDSHEGVAIMTCLSTSMPADATTVSRRRRGLRFVVPGLALIALAACSGDGSGTVISEPTAVAASDTSAPAAAGRPAAEAALAEQRTAHRRPHTRGILGRPRRRCNPHRVGRSRLRRAGRRARSCGRVRRVLPHRQPLGPGSHRDASSRARRLRRWRSRRHGGGRLARRELRRTARSGLPTTCSPRINGRLNCGEHDADPARSAGEPVGRLRRPRRTSTAPRRGLRRRSR